MCRFCGAVLTDEPLPRIAPIRTPPRRPAPPPKPQTVEEIRTATREEFHRRGLALSRQAWSRIEQVLSRAEDQYREATALFIDVCDFTRLFGHLATESVKAHMQQFYELCSHYIELYNGFIVKFIGDAVLAIFGAPVAYDRDVESAVRAAVEIREATALLPALGEHRIRIRAGLDTGIVLSTVVRTHARADFDVFGEAIIIAQRLQAQAEPGEILASGATYRRVKNLFEATALGPVTLKNLSEPVDAFRIVRLRDKAVIRREFVTPFIGRRREMARVREEIERVIDGRGPRFIAIAGEAGVGKTRLVWEAVQPFLSRVRLLRADCEPHGVKIPFYAVIALLRRLLELPAELSSRQTEQRIEEYFEENPLVESEQVSCFHYLFMLQPGIEKYAQVPAPALRRSIMATLMTFLRGLLEHGPLVLFLDDLQWIDPSSAEFLGTLVDGDGLEGLLVVVAYRHGYRLPEKIEARFTHLALASLSQRERTQLIDWLVKKDGLGPLVREVLLQKAGGNPLFLEETARTILRLWEEQDLRGVPEAARIEDVVPESLREIIQARIDALERKTRLVLQCGAVLGRRFAFSVIELFDMIREGLLDRLYILKGLQFLYERPRPEDLEFVFRHGLTQEVAYQSLLDEQKRQLHGLIAEQLESKFEQEQALEANCSILAYHYVRSDNRAKAVEWTARGAERAARLFANDEALDLYEQAIAILQTMEQTESHRREMARLLRGRGRLLRFSGRLDEADESFRSLLAIAEDLGDARLQADAWAEIGMNHSQRGRYGEADRRLRQAVSAYEQTGDRAGLAMACNALGVNCFTAGDLQGALAWFERAGSLQIESQNPAIAADIYNNRGLVLWRCRDYQAALDSIGKARSIWHNIRNQFGLCATTLNIGILQENLGRLSQALENYENALRLARRLFYRQAESTILINMGNALRRRGELGRASETNARAAEMARRLGHKLLEATALENLGLDALASGRHGEARAYFSQGLDAIGPNGDPERRASLMLGLAQAHLAADHLDEATKAFVAAREIINENKCEALRAAQYRTQALLASRQKPAQASSLFETAVEAARRAGNPWDEMEALRAWIEHCENTSDTQRLGDLAQRLAGLNRRLEL